MQLINKTKGTTIASQVVLAKSFLPRLKGLLGYKSLPVGRALVLHPCSSVHTCFMKFSIDVVFLDSSGRVINFLEKLAPWRFSPVIWGSTIVIELPSGSIKGNLSAGDLLELQNYNGGVILV